MPDLIKLVRCRLCNGEFSTEVLQLKPTPPANTLYKFQEDAISAKKFPLNVRMCSRCKHFQLTEIVNPKLLFDDYVYRTGTSTSFHNHFKDFVKSLEPWLKPNAMVLEVGSNDGLLLGLLRDAGFNVTGIEPSELLVAESKAKKLNVHQGYFEENFVASNFGLTKFDLIVGNNVFAHIENLSGAIELAGKMLNTGGTLVFEVAHFLKILTDNTFDSIYHEHMSYHTVISMQKYLQEFTALEVYDVELIQTHGGSLRFYVGKKGEHKIRESAIAEIIQVEINNGLDNSKVLIKIAEQVNELKSKVKKYFEKLKSDESLILGYAAPAKAVTFLAELELENLGILLIIDDNPDKQNRFLPGSGIKIVSFAQAQEYFRSYKTSINKNIEYYCIFFAWNIGKELYNKVKDLELQNLKVLSFYPTFSQEEIA